MNESGEHDQESIREVATRLSLDVSNDGLDAALESALDLVEAVPESTEIDERESVGSIADDPNNALLEVYEEPRVESEDGPLSGLEMVVKDVIAVKDLTLTCGSKSFAVVPSYDATVVESLLDAGVELVGKANTDAFAFGPTGEFSEFGKVINPVDRSRVPGGSSSGSAAAVGAGTVDASLGTDTGGSVRIPANCCGVVGVKPTHRSMSRYGFVDLAPTTDTIGTLARDVATAARVLEVIRGEDVQDPSSAHVAGGDPLSDELLDVDSLSVGLVEPYFERSSMDVAETVRDGAASLDDLDQVTVESVDLNLGQMEQAYPLTIATEFAWLLRQRGIVRGQGTQYSEEWRQTFSNFTDSINEHIALRVLPAAYLDEYTNGRSYVAAREEVTSFKKRIRRLFDEYDLLMTPTMRVVPPKYGEVTATEGMENISGNTGPFSLTGNPAVTVPVGSVDGLSVGAQLVAPEFDDRIALQGAALLESLC